MLTNAGWVTATTLLLLAATGAGMAAAPQAYDIVIVGGRVMDPASGLDAVRNVGVRDGRIAAISSETLTGERTIDASGLVVAPGFIDLHAHGQSEEAYGFAVRDGVTSALELEVGVGDIEAFYGGRAGGQLINYGASIGHIPVRMIVMDDPGDFLPSGPANDQAASDEQIAEMARRIDEGLASGAVAVGFGIAYTPAATDEEIRTMLRVAAAQDAVAHVHVRGGVEGLTDLIERARETGTALHIVHANSSGGEESSAFIDVIERAHERGQDVTTEAYPYEAGATRIESALFDGWEGWPDERFGIYQWVETGERLTRESFARYREQGGSVIIHSRTEEMTLAAFDSPLTMVASDGRIADGRGHPRSAGTFAKVLGRYVRELGAFDLMDALRRMTIEPAQRLEHRVEAMRRKGRIEVGADADITIFDPETIIDRATYTDPAVPSAGIEYVLVNGTLTVERGRLVPGARAGRPLRAETEAPVEGSVPVGTASLYTRAVGQGQPLIVLHGGPDFDHLYLLPELDRLADSFRLIYYEQRGRGASATGVEPEDVTLASEIEDLDTVRQHFDLDAPAVLGHSWGAVLALEYAIRHPTRVSHLVLMNPAPASASDLTMFQQAYLEKIGADMERQREIVDSAAYREGDPEAVVARYRIHFRPAFHHTEHYERFMTTMQAAFRSQGADGIVKARAVEERIMQDTWDVEGYDLLPQLRDLNIPTLVITGEQDFIPVQVAANIADAIPNATLVTLANCGHFTYLECPAEVRVALDEFFGSVPAAQEEPRQPAGSWGR